MKAGTGGNVDIKARPIKAGLWPGRATLRPGLNEDAKSAAQVFGMGEGLELAVLFGVPLAEGIVLERLIEDTGQELGLGAKTFRLQAGGFAGALDGREIDVGGQVLFAGMCQEIIADVVTMIGAKRPAGAAGRKQFGIGEAIINRHELPICQGPGGSAPPILGGGTGFNGIEVRQHFLKLRRYAQAGKFKGGRQTGPDEPVCFDGDRPFKPGFFSGIPAEAVDRKGIKQFVAENDAAERRMKCSQMFKAGKPSHLMNEVSQARFLPGLAARRWLENAEFDLLQKFWVMLLQPGENIASQPAIMGASFDDLQPRTVHFWRFEPGGELARQELTEQAADADAGDKVAGPANNVLLRFIVTSFGTVKSHFHEAGKRNCTPGENFFADEVGGHFHCLQEDLALISVANN